MFEPCRLIFFLPIPYIQFEFTTETKKHTLKRSSTTILRRKRNTRAKHVSPSRSFCHSSTTIVSLMSRWREPVGVNCKHNSRVISPRSSPWNETIRYRSIDSAAVERIIVWSDLSLLLYSLSLDRFTFFANIIQDKYHKTTSVKTCDWKYIFCFFLFALLFYSLVTQRYVPTIEIRKKNSKKRVTRFDN